MLTVSQAARRVRRNPETVRRWIRAGKLPARKVGTQYAIDELDFEAFRGSETLPLPPEWQATSWGGPMPDVVAAVHRSRTGH